MYKAIDEFTTEELRPLTMGRLPDGDEYHRRIRERLPTSLPRFMPGQFVYDSMKKANVPVVAVYWDAQLGGALPCWRVHTPGHGGSEWSFCQPDPHSPTLMFRCSWRTLQGSSSWEQIGEMPPIRETKELWLCNA